MMKKFLFFAVTLLAVAAPRGFAQGRAVAHSTSTSRHEGHSAEYADQYHGAAAVR